MPLEGHELILAAQLAKAESAKKTLKKSPEPTDKIKANRSNVLENAMRDQAMSMNHYESAPPRRNTFGSSYKMANFPLPEMMTSRRKIDLDAASVTSKEEVILNVATDKNLQSDRSSILNVDPGSDKKK